MNHLDPPMYLEEGSEGMIVNHLLKHLDTWAEMTGRGPTGIVLDRQFGPTGVRWLKEYQKANGLEVDGGCGPETRRKLLENGFDFRGLARAVNGVDMYV